MQPHLTVHGSQHFSRRMLLVVRVSDIHTASMTTNYDVGTGLIHRLPSEVHSVRHTWSEIGIAKELVPYPSSLSRLHQHSLGSSHFARLNSRFQSTDGLARFAFGQHRPSPHFPNSKHQLEAP
jgi:hypothetical protein